MKGKYRPNRAIGLFEFADMFREEASARKYLEDRRWKGHPACPHCRSSAISAWNRKGSPGWHRCRSCRKQFTVRKDSIFECSKLPLKKWMLLLYFIIEENKGISSRQAIKFIRTMQRTSWFAGHRARMAMGGHKEGMMLEGNMEIDTTFVGGKEKNKHKKKRLFPGGGSGGKIGVFGMRERGGRMVSVILPSNIGQNTKGMPILIPDESEEVLKGIMGKWVKKGSIVNTDGGEPCQWIMDMGYEHRWVNHARKIYAKKHENGETDHINTKESDWARLKRKYHGVHHNISPKNLHRYIEEFDFKHNMAGVMNASTMDAINAIIDGCWGKRLTYNELTGRGNGGAGRACPQI